MMTSPVVVRLGGYRFAQYTLQFRKPFDHGVSRAMIHTAKDLLFTSGADTAFTQSDTILLIFMNGLSLKAESMLPSRASVVFHERIREKRPRGLATFYTETVVCKDVAHLLDVMKHYTDTLHWAALQTLAQMVRVPLSSDDLVSDLERHSVFVTDQPVAMMRGTYLKRFRDRSTGKCSIREVTCSWPLGE